MELLAKPCQEVNRPQPLAGPLSRWIGAALRLLVGNARSNLRADDRARAADQLRLHLSLLSDAELADYGLRRKEIAEFVDGGLIERP